ncbi:MAG: hypothetical protein CSA22_03875 [Deltaproteobacteria bacterium]|nr:MAG: hypothetical protein CSA22_03875 [Deltaproteobacteria bacterium]
MQITLDLSKHCVQTALKSTYNRLLSAYFKADAPDDRNRMEIQLEMVTVALSCFDFMKLRSEFSVLAGGDGCFAILSGDPDAVCLVLDDGRTISPRA